MRQWGWRAEQCLGAQEEDRWGCGSLWVLSLWVLSCGHCPMAEMHRGVCHSLSVAQPGGSKCLHITSSPALEQDGSHNNPAQSRLLFPALGALPVGVSAALPHPALALTYCGSLLSVSRLSSGLDSGSSVAAGHPPCPKQQLWGWGSCQAVLCHWRLGWGSLRAAWALTWQGGYFNPEAKADRFVSPKYPSLAR